MKTRANEKKTKDLKSNVVTISANNQKTNYSEEPYRKKLNLKKRIKTIQRNIKFINNLYTLIAVVISFFIQIRIMDMCDEITRESYYFSIVGICMISYYLLAVMFYFVSTYPYIIKREKEIDRCNAKIEEIESISRSEMNRIINHIKFCEICRQTDSIMADDKYNENK